MGDRPAGGSGWLVGGSTSPLPARPRRALARWIEIDGGLEWHRRAPLFDHCVCCIWAFEVDDFLREGLTACLSG